jgi:2'-5' RNA ligase
MASRDRQARIDRRDSADSTLPMLAAEPTLNRLAIDPADPTDKIEPAEPMDRIDPADPMDRIEPVDPIDKMESPVPRADDICSCSQVPAGPARMSAMAPDADFRGDTGSAVVVPVPEADAIVAGYRARLDRAATLGVPAHVTLLAPFLPPPLITAATIATLAEIAGSAAAFDCAFGRTAWFGDRVLWLAPEPDGPFRELTRRLTAAFPQCPPYGGLFADVIPHLTVGEDEAGGAGPLRAAQAAVTGQLPVAALISRAWLMCGTAEPGSWHRVAELPLRPREPGH